MRSQGTFLWMHFTTGSGPGGDELTWVVLYVVVLESRGACDRCEDFPVALTLLLVGPYVEVEGLLLDV